MSKLLLLLNATCPWMRPTLSAHCGIISQTKEPVSRKMRILEGFPRTEGGVWGWEQHLTLLGVNTAPVSGLPVQHCTRPEKASHRDWSAGVRIWSRGTLVLSRNIPPEAPQLTDMQWSSEANENRGLSSEKISYKHRTRKGCYASMTEHTVEEPKRREQNCPNAFTSSHCPTWAICYLHTHNSSSETSGLVGNVSITGWTQKFSALKLVLPSIT